VVCEYCLTSVSTRCMKSMKRKWWWKMAIKLTKASCGFLYMIKRYSTFEPNEYVFCDLDRWQRLKVILLLKHLPIKNNYFGNSPRRNFVTVPFTYSPCRYITMAKHTAKTRFLSLICLPATDNNWWRIRREQTRPWVR